MSEDFNLPELLGKLESPHLEHIPLEADAEQVSRAACAFLNTGGGTAIIEVGLDSLSASRRQTEIEQQLRQRINPPALWSVAPAQTGVRHYCILDVPAGRDRPYTVEGTIFVRRGARTVAARSEEIRDIVEESFTGSERWERKLLPSAGIERLDSELIRSIASDAQDRHSYQFSDVKKVETILADLALYRQQSITQAAEVLFGRKPALQFPQIRVRVTVYSQDKGGDFVDNKQFDVAALTMLEDVFAMIRKHTTVASTFERGLRRTDRPEFPEAAVREGLVNAFVHRDYANFSGGIAVDLYPGRLVIWNSGSLPAGLHIGDLNREHPSMPRNPDIAQVFFLRRLMERVGRGTQKIIAACKDAGLPVPKWKSDESGVTLTFVSKASTAFAKLNLRQQKLLDELNAGEVVRLPDYCERLAVSIRQARRDLGTLVDYGWLVREGDGPTTLFRRTDQKWQPARPGQTRPN
jgi:ATP-dependent DNA helicase RecG